MRVFYYLMQFKIHDDLLLKWGSAWSGISESAQSSVAKLLRRFRYVCPFRPQSVRMPLPLYVRTTRFTQFPHFSSRWPAVPHWEWMFRTVDHIFYDRVEVNDWLTESSCSSGLWPVNLLLTQTLHCIALLSCYPYSPTMHWDAVPSSV